MDNKVYSHILQKSGVLKNFTVAKIVKKREIDELKKIIRSVTETEEEYNKVLSEEIVKISNMHDEKNPVPGIIYTNDPLDIRELLFSVAKKFTRTLGKHKLTKIQMAFLITSIINELELGQDDFESLKEELEDDDDTESPSF